MSDKKIASFEELDKVDGIEYDAVEAYGTVVGIGSLPTSDLHEWIESNESEDKGKKREAGLRLLVKSIVDNNHNRVSKENFEAWVAKFRAKSNKENGKVIAAALRLNGFDTEAEKQIKNDSSEATTGASPSDSPSPQGA